MKAIDTNVVLRLLLGDDTSQAAIAETLLEDGIVVVPTVLLECAWVLRSRYDLDRADAAAMLARLVELPGVHIQEPALVTWAIERFAAGADIADMIHLVAAFRTSAFATFDKRIARLAGPDTPLPIETLA